MKRAAVVLLAWGAWLGVWTAVQALFSDATLPERTIQWVMLGAASAASLLAGAVLWRLDAPPRRAESPRLIADQSVASTALVVGLAMALVGASFGLWLLLIGGGVAALGLGGVCREARARRRTLRRGGGTR